MESVKNKRKKIFKILLILLNVGIIAGIALSEFSNSKNAAKLRETEINFLWALPALGCFLTAIIAESFKYSSILKAVSGKGNFLLSAKTVVLGRYYDNITPFGAGGQPFQIYLLNQNGYSADKSAVVPIAGFVSTQYGFIILALLSFSFGWVFRSHLNSDIGNIVRITGYVGLFFYSSVPIMITVFTFFPKAASKIIGFFISILCKLKIVKDSKIAVIKTYRYISKYSICLKGVLKKKGLCVRTMLLSVLYQFSLCSIPFFLLHAFGGSMGFFQCLITTISIYCAITIVPTPGNSGAAEGSFYAVFSSLSEGYIFWAMLGWRFFCFYVFILAGLGIYLKDYFGKKKTLRR